MSRNRKSDAIIEQLVSDLKTSQSGVHANNGTSQITEMKRPANKSPARDSEIGKYSSKKVQKNVSSGNSKKRRLPEHNNSGKGRRTSEKSSSQHGADDYKVRHNYSSNFKNRGPPRNNKINCKTSNIKSLLPLSNFSNLSSFSSLPIYSGGQNSLYTGSTNSILSTIFQLVNSGQNFSSIRSNRPVHSSTTSTVRSHSNQSKANQPNSKKPPVQSESSKKVKRPAPRAEPSKREDVRSENRESREPKPKTESSPRKERDDDHKRSPPSPGPSGRRRNISDRVINRIKADRKFQAKVKTLIESGTPTVNKTLVDENAQSESAVEDKVASDAGVSDAGVSDAVVPDAVVPDTEVPDAEVSSGVVSGGVVSKADDALPDEEMDWETSEQENMIQHIKTIRKNLNSTKVSSEFALQSNNSFKILTDNVLLVLDTNVFISCLSFIRDIRDAFLPDLGLPSIFIPWAVLRELDHLKMTSSEQLARSAVRAIRYINETFSSNHPRVSGQSFEDFCMMKNSACDCTDDEILNSCMHLKMTNSQRRIMLITNDKNLESKALVSGVQAYSKQRFVNEVINKTKDCENDANSQNMMVVRYTLYPKLKILMKIALEMVVESELKKAFGRNWLYIVIRKPPWNLIHVFECFLRHWRSVFTFTFEGELYSAIEDVKKMFMSEDDGPGKGQKFSSLIQISVDLLKSVRHQISLKASLLSSPEYTKLVDHLSKALQEIEILRQAENKLTQEQSPDVHMPNCAPIDIEDFVIGEPPASGSQLCKEEVKALFQIIWNQVQSFCLRVTELATNYAMAGPDVVEQVKHQFPQVIQKLQELIENIEKIVSLEPQQLAQSGQLIIDFTNFLISLNVLQIDTINVGVLLKNIGFFCCDDESRVVLHIFNNDLKQFGNQIIDGMKCLGFI